MSVVQRKKLDSNSDSTIQLIEKVLSDNRKVYSIGLCDESDGDSIIIECINYDKAIKLFDLMNNESDYIIG